MQGFTPDSKGRPCRWRMPRPAVDQAFRISVFVHAGIVINERCDTSNLPQTPPRVVRSLAPSAVTRTMFCSGLAVHAVLRAGLQTIVASIGRHELARISRTATFRADVIPRDCLPRTLVETNTLKRWLKARESSPLRMSSIGCQASAAAPAHMPTGQRIPTKSAEGANPPNQTVK